MTVTCWLSLLCGELAFILTSTTDFFFILIFKKSSDNLSNIHLARRPFMKTAISELIFKLLLTHYAAQQNNHDQAGARS